MCGSIVEVTPDFPTYREACCPICLDKIEEIVLSKGLVVPAPEEYKQAQSIFEKYFQKFGFSEFEKLFGYSVFDFEKIYNGFKIYIDGFYDGFVSGHGSEYGENEVRFPLVADISCCFEPQFYASMSKDHRVRRYSLVDVLKKEYFIRLLPIELEYKSCEEVMKELLELYWLNFESLEEEKTEREKYKNNPLILDDIGTLPAVHN